MQPELIAECLVSLRKRGFYNGVGDPEPQLCAVLEEVGEVARLLRRAAQGQPLDHDKLLHECADVFIASVCLAGTLCGDNINWGMRVTWDQTPVQALCLIALEIGFLEGEAKTYQGDLMPMLLSYAWSLLSTVAGEAYAPDVVRTVLQAGEARGYLHGGQP